MTEAPSECLNLMGGLILNIIVLVPQLCLEFSPWRKASSHGSAYIHKRSFFLLVPIMCLCTRWESLGHITLASS